MFKIVGIVETAALLSREIQGTYENSPFVAENVGLFLEDETYISECDVLDFWCRGNHGDLSNKDTRRLT